MKCHQLFPLLALIAAPAVYATQQPVAHRRHHAQLVARQAMGSNQTFGEPEQESAAPIASSVAIASSSAVLPSASAAESEAPEPSAFSSSAVIVPSSSAVVESSAVSSAAEVPSSAAVPSSSSALVIPSSASSEAPIPSSISSSAAPSIESIAASTPVTTITSTASNRVPSLVSVSRSASASASAAGSNGEEEKKSGGLSKTALIAIIVVASVVGLIAAGWTLFRKWKLRPSNKFDERMQPIDFSPTTGDLPDPFLEKTRHRPSSMTSINSVSSADRQRQQFVSELDAVPGYPPVVSGVPQHDFTAGDGYAEMHRGPALAPGQYYDQPSPDAYEQTREYDYSQGHAQYPPQPYDHSHQQYGHPQAQGPYQDDYDYAAPGLQREPSLGRPTGGHDGPYAQAAQYRSY